MLPATRVYRRVSHHFSAHFHLCITRGANAVAKESPRIVRTTSRPKSHRSLYRPPLRAGYDRRGVAISFVANHIAVHVIVITTVLAIRFQFKVKLLVSLDNKWIFKTRVAIGRSSKQRRPIGKPKPNRATGVICELNVPQLRMPVPNMDYWRVDKNSFPAPRDLYWWRKIDWHRRGYEDCSCSVWHFVSPFVN